VETTSQTAPRDGAGPVHARAGLARRAALRALAACAALAGSGCHLVEADL
jgi:hypothetical protein